MASRHSAARPKRDGETFARTHHNDADGDPTKTKFDVRNPSILAPEAREEDAVLDADVIGGTNNSTKRGAVNLDGYDSDSENDTFNDRAKTRKTGAVNILEQLDNYDSKGGNAGGQAGDRDDEDEDDDDDMFAADPKETDPATKKDEEGTSSKKKKVQFMDNTEIAGQEEESRTGGTVRLDDREDSEDDEEETQRATQDDGVDAEVGAGGLKKNAPKLEAFNLKAEMEDGQFDDSGNYVRRAGDPDAVHDNWLEGLSKKEMKKAADAHEKREADARQQRLQEDNVLVSDLLRMLIIHLERAETPLEALARFGKGQTKTKKIPKWKLKKLNKGTEEMDVDQKVEEDPEQARIKTAISAVTDAADKLLSRDHEEIYDQEREMLVRQWQRETGEDWVEPAPRASDETDTTQLARTWEFRWTDGRDGATQGPFDSPAMKAWQDAGYFGEGVEFRPSGEDADWSRVASFA